LQKPPRDFNNHYWFIRGSAFGPIGGLSARQFDGCLPRREEKREEKRSGIRIRIAGLIEIRIRMSAGFLQKRCGFIASSASAIAPSFVKICMRNANKFPKIPYSAMVRNRKLEK